MIARFIFLLTILIFTSELRSQDISFEDILEGQNINFTKSIISTLSSPEFEGRDFTKPSIHRSILFIESLLRAYNIKTYFDAYKVSYKIKDSLYGYNIVGLYRGNLRTKTAILLTANYDNLGLVKDRTKKDTVLKGANDNASGVSALFQLALFFNKIKPRENIIFAFTSGKHQNMLGAGFLADTLKKHEYLDIKYVINFEMLGRPMSETQHNLLCIQDTTSNIVELFNSHIRPDFMGKAEGDEFKDGSEHSPFYNILQVPCATVTSFNFNNDKHYLSTYDDIDNLYIDYLHRTTARVTLALYNIINRKQQVSFNKMETPQELQESQK